MKTLIRNATRVLLGVAVSGVLAGAATAQQNESVIVTGPYVSKVERLGIRAGETTMSMQRLVPYRDLDLRRAGDVQELWRRIDSTALEICRELERRYPEGSEPRRGCVPEAVGGATGQVDGAVSRASFTP
jgi:UrcA family protein